jgi:hypothetical protein
MRNAYGNGTNGKETRALCYFPGMKRNQSLQHGVRLLDMYGRNKERMEARYLAGRQSGVANFFISQVEKLMFPGWVILSMALRWHFFFHISPLPSRLSVEGRKEGQKRGWMGWDGMGCM